MISRNLLHELGKRDEKEQPTQQPTEQVVRGKVRKWGRRETLLPKLRTQRKKRKSQDEEKRDIWATTKPSGIEMETLSYNNGRNWAFLFPDFCFSNG
jgi:hypothetical protein